jgi:hypothetical protein
MSVRARFLKAVALVVVVSMPLLGLSTVASAKVKGCHKTHSCKSGGTGSGGGTGGTPPLMTVQLDPNPLVETSQSNVDAVIQVETNPSLAGDEVVIQSSQLLASCSILYLETAQSSGPKIYHNTTYSTNAPLTVTLDNDGNVTVIANGYNCAPGNDIIEADLAVAPFYTALGTLVVAPPQVTTPGVTGTPNPEVETGDTAASGDSNVYAVFYVETDPVYAEQTVEISDNQLFDSCITSSVWYDSYTDFLSGSTPQETLDDDGNAVFVFVGSSCAAGTTEVIADVLAGSHPTYVTTYTVNPPAPTI